MGLKRSLDSLLSSLNRGRESRALRRLQSSPIGSLLRMPWLKIGYVVALFLMASGVFNALLEGSRSEYGAFIYVPTRTIQNINETIINLFVLLMGVGGILLIHKGGKEAYRRRISNFYLLLGFTFILIALYMGSALLSAKFF